MTDRTSILVVEDDTESLRELRSLLERAGYLVDEAADGQSALRAFGAREPNLVLLSSRLPDTSPFELLDALRVDGQARDVPVIFIATPDDAEIRHRGLESGDDLIERPFDPPEVLARVERQVTVAKARMALRKSEAEFRSVMESAVDAIISGDADGTIRSWNSAASALFGFSQSEVIGEPIELIIPERFREPHQKGLRRVSSGGPSRVIGKTVELAAMRKDGSEFPIELSLATWLLDDRRYYTGIIRDIGERKRAEEALLASEAALRDKTAELEEKNEALARTVARLNEAHNQLVVQKKMASLGKLSAGMAHELNNPASAVQRGADQLRDAISKLLGVQLRLYEQDFGQAELEALSALEGVAQERATKPTDLDALGRADREAEIEAWLEERGIDRAWDLAPDLVGMGCIQEDLESLSQRFGPAQLPVALEWLSRSQAVYGLIAELGLGAHRITELVGALKSYTYMDRAPIQSVDVREGLDSTLIILHSKLKAGVTVHRAYDEDVPRIQARGSELNQVWTNLIDNAIDAMDGRGELHLRVRSEPPWLVVEVEDEGPGIPEDLGAEIFDPFVTTKSPGEGTGLGLNISYDIVVKKHAGRIDFDSSPEGTRFRVRLPLDSEASGEGPRSQNEERVTGGGGDG